MLFRSRIPAPPLDRFIKLIWLCESEPRSHAIERILPSGAAQIIVNLQENEVRRYELAARGGLRCIATAGSVLAGVQSRYSLIDTAEQQHVAGVAFAAGGTVPFFRAPASETRDDDVPLEALWGRRIADDVRSRLLEARGADAKLDVLEQALTDVYRPAAVHRGVAHALDVFGRRPLAVSVQSVTDAIGLSPKRFIERFKAEVGVTPKRYCRILRFQRALARAHAGRGVDWPGLALDCGYFDQAHFIHDFRSFSGLTPTAYVASRTEFQNHVKFLQETGGGA